SLPWVGATKVMDYHCLVYRLPAGKRPSRKAHRTAVAKVQQSLLALKLPRTLQTRFVRSKPTLAKRLRSQAFERLGIAADTTEDCDLLDKLNTQLPDMLERMSHLPITLHTPDLGAEQLWQADDSLYCLHWGRWTLEPAGAGFISKLDQLTKFEEIISLAQADQALLEQASMDDIRLAALLHMLEANCHRERLKTGLDIAHILLRKAA